MNAAVKMLIGILIAIAGIYWYLGDFIGKGWTAISGINAWNAFVTVFIGVFGIVLFFSGLLIAWIEYEDLKFEKEEKKRKRK
jgi:TRAP-type C4-dicarboxylate transport system permease small subunit